MKIQFLNGGLANQTFQYIFVRFAELYRPGDEWYLDDSFFWVHHVHNGYELEKVFGVKPKLLSNYFDQDVWEEMIRLKRNGTSIPQTFLNMGIPMKMIAETSNHSEFNPFKGEISMIEANEFHPEIIGISNENIYYHGYWLNGKYLKSFSKEILTELSFPPLSDEVNRRYAEKISESLSVGVHIRRGDFVTIGCELPEEFYMAACKQVAQKHPGAEFYVFSDDVDWCRSKADALGLNLTGACTFVTGNTDGKNYIDLQLLSLCRGMIMSNSSFCYLAALMDEKLEFYINPTNRKL